jgi:alpha/beta superfamily hydrolase
VTVAPPIGRWDFSKIDSPSCPWLIIQGSRDELVDAMAVEAWFISLKDRSITTSQLLVLPDADHFFHARLHEIREAVSRFVSGHVEARSE